MKKLSIFTLLTVTTLALTACAGNETKTPEQPTTEAPVVETVKTYTNGTYRGGYLDGSVEVELTLNNNIVENIKYRKLNYKDTNFLAEDATEMTQALASQYQALIDHLVGKDITALEDLYYPGNIAQDVDGLASASVKDGEVIDVVTGATVRSGKIISAINDGLNRGAYKLAE